MMPMELSRKKTEELITKHYGAVFAIAFARLRNFEEAEDLAQETFFRALIHQDNLKSPEGFLPWVCCIARNLAVDNQRRRLRRDEIDEYLKTLPQSVPPEVSEVIEQKEMLEKLEDALESLSPSDSEIIVLHYLHRMKKKDIASLLNVHPSTVGRRIESAKDQLRELLETEKQPVSNQGMKKTLATGAAISALSAAQRKSLVKQIGTAGLDSASISASSGLPSGILPIAATFLIILMGIGFYIVGKESIEEKSSDTEFVQTDAQTKLPETQTQNEEAETSIVEFEDQYLVENDLFADMEPSIPVLASMRGVIRNTEGDPVSNAVISIHNLRGYGHTPALLSTLSNRDGEFVLEGIAVESGLVRIESEDYMTYLDVIDFSATDGYGAGDVSLLLEGEPLEREYTMSSGIPVSGEVIDAETKEPIQDAQVSFLYNNYFLIENIKTDTSGVFTFTQMPEEPGILVIEAKGYQTFFDTEWSPESGSVLTIPLEKGGVAIEGIVVDAATGKGIEGASVVVTSTGTEVIALIENTNEKGEFQTSSIPNGEWTLSNSHFGQRTLVTQDENFQINNQNSENIWKRLEMTSPQIIRGQLVDEKTGDPIEGAFVRLSSHWEGGRVGNRMGAGPGAFTDEKGRFYVPDVSWGFMGGIGIGVLADGYMDASAPIENGTAGVDPEPVTIKMSRGWLLTGRVIGEDGLPVANAELRDNPRQFTNIDPIVSDSDGRFSVQLNSNPTEHDYSLYSNWAVTAPDGRTCLEQIKWPEGKDHFEKDFVVKEGHQGFVSVYEETDVPAEGVEVFLFSYWDGELDKQSRDRPRYYRLVETDQNGLATFQNLPALSYSVSVIKKDGNYFSAKEKLNLLSEEKQDSVVMILSDHRSKLAGQVVDEDGEPVADVEVKISQGDETKTDNEGRFELDITTSDYTLIFQKDGFNYHSVYLDDENRSSGNMEVVLKRLVNISGKVRREDGKPVLRQVTVTAFYKDDDGEPVSLISKQQVLPDSNGDVTVSLPGYQNVASNKEVMMVVSVPDEGLIGSSEWIIPSNSLANEYHVALSKSVLSSIVVSAETNEPVQDAFVVVGSVHSVYIDRPNLLQHHPWPWTKTDDSGKFELSGIPSWQDKLTVGAENFQITSVKISENLKNENELLISLSKGITWQGSVLHADRTPITYGYLHLVQDEGNLAMYSTEFMDDNSKFEATGLHPVETEISVSRHWASSNTWSWKSTKLISNDQDIKEDIILPSMVTKQLQITGEYHAMLRITSASGEEIKLNLRLDDGKTNTDVLLFEGDIKIEQYWRANSKEIYSFPMAELTITNDGKPFELSMMPWDEFSEKAGVPEKYK